MEANGWGDLIEYAGCAAGMFFAYSAPMMIGAALNCARVFAAAA
jgi:hypothetical protein